MRVTATLALSLLLSMTLSAAELSLPQRDTVAANLRALEQHDSLSESERLRRDHLTDTLKFLDQAEHNKAKLKQVLRAQQQAPAQLDRVRTQLTEFTPFDGATTEFTALDIRALVTELTDSLSQLEDLQEALAATSSELINYQTLPEQTQTTLRQALQRQDQIRRRLSLTATRSESLTNAAVDALHSEQYALETRVELFQRELWSSDSLNRLAAARQHLLLRQIDALEAKIELVQETLNSKRIARTENLINQAQDTFSEHLQDGSPLQKIADQNRQLSQQIQAVSAETNDVIRRNIRVRTQLDRLRQTERNLGEQIELLKGSLILSRILYDTQKQLPSVQVDKSLPERIKDVRLQQFQMGQASAARAPLEQQAKTWLAAQQLADDAAADQWLQAAEKLIGIQNELTSQLDAEMSRYLNIAIGLQVSQEQLKSLAASVRDTVREHSFWMPSNQVLDLDWWLELPSTLIAQWQPSTWQLPAVQSLKLSGNGVLLCALAMILVVRRRHWKRQLASLDKEIGKVREDSQMHTPRALLLSLLLESAVPLLLLAGWAFATQNALLISASILWRLALLWLVLAVCLRLLRQDGVAEKHFHWSRQQRISCRYWLLLFSLSLLGPIVFAAIEARQPELLPGNAFAMLILMASMPLTALALTRLTMNYPASRPNSFMRRVFALLAAALPLALVAATMAGYFYSAVKLSGRLIESFYLLLLWSLISNTAIRGLAVAARRLKFKRILARRQSREDTDEEGHEAPPEAPPLDLEQVNQQSLRILRMGLLIGFAVVFYLIWSDLLGTFGYLDSVVLWQTSSGEGDAQIWQTVGLGDAITAIVTVVVTLGLARNLPGLLEVLILSRLSLRPGSSYAITTLLSYVIVTTGLLTALSNIGFEWSKLQWLVAALGVGLGFGLQEIFANFVSGLIILFERPARIGDVITIGDLSGTVSRIRIRATTIIDFERKEIIVPNKSFVTDRLINWSLTDSVTRITIVVGFAYGSDLEKARAVLLQAAEENSRVLKEPQPQALFMSFGASTLDHELRVHVKEVLDRIVAIDELNRRIDALCREQDIEIAFSQLDIHIRSSDGTQEAQLTPPSDNSSNKPDASSDGR